MRPVIVADKESYWEKISDIDTISSDEFLATGKYPWSNVRVFNLCRSYDYQSSGYYVSLLASARGQKVVPTVETILDMKSRAFIKLRSDDLDVLIQKSLKGLESTSFELSIYFGRNLAKRYEKLAFELHKVFNAPLMRAKFKFKDKWVLQSLKPISLDGVPDSHREQLLEFAKSYFQKRQSRRRIKASRFDLAILVDPGEKQPPSDAKALNLFVQAASRLEINTDFITKDDYHRLAEYDGLFIRTTTSVNHHTFRFAHKAQSLGMVVIDDPLSILRCTNKVYLAELFERYKIPCPKTALIHKNSSKRNRLPLDLPVVLKLPDSSFSHGVIKVTTNSECQEALTSMFASSDIVIAQEFLPTPFDWRIGVLAGKVLYACKYYMAEDHWQIYQYDDKNTMVSCGDAHTFTLDQVPKKLRLLSEKVAKHMGSGLYGLDVKELDHKFYVIEVNDNPSIDAGCEDEVLGQGLYDAIMTHFHDKMMEVALGKGVPNDD